MKTPFEIYNESLVKYNYIKTGEALTISTMMAAVEALQEIAAALSDLSSAIGIVADRGK